MSSIPINNVFVFLNGALLFFIFKFKMNKISPRLYFQPRGRMTFFFFSFFFNFEVIINTTFFLKLNINIIFLQFNHSTEGKFFIHEIIICVKLSPANQNVNTITISLGCKVLKHEVNLMKIVILKAFA